MQRIWPPEEAGNVDASGLERMYGYPDGRSWLTVNFVSSVDGAMTVQGRSAPLSTSPDRRVYKLGRDLSDVVLIGAGTAVREEFHGMRPADHDGELRARHGLSPVTPIAVVTTGYSLPPDAPVLTDVQVPTIVLTCASAPEDIRTAWADAGAEVVLAGQETVSPKQVRSALESRGLLRIDCEGGPRLFTSLCAAGVVDELRLTVSPFLVAGAEGRITNGAGLDPSQLRLETVLAEADTLMLRYFL